MAARLWICAAALAAGCAGRQQPPGLAHEFQGRPYTIRHSGDLGVPPGSGAAVRGRGGRIDGQVCGMDVHYDVAYDGDDVQLTGFLDARFPSEIHVRQEGAARVFTGSLGSAAGKAAVSLRLSPDALVGRVGFRYYDLAAVPGADRLTGGLVIGGTNVPTTATVLGEGALLNMPLADQGAVLPNLLTCFIARVGVLGRSPLQVQVGGPYGAEPRESSSLYER